MPLSNAERQRRWRDKLRAAAGGGQAQNATTISTTLPSALGQLAEELFREDDDEKDPARSAAWVAAEGIWQMLDFLSHQLGLDMKEPTKTQKGRVIMNLLGGEEYLHAIEAWRAEFLVWDRSRKRDKGPPPEPPFPPGQ